ncbi:leucine-rich repeat domain-containing protein [Pseudohaliea rubra]|nr:leucine-rich repeat domain-containing protein [Pseudohaliea rubra]
MRPHRFALLFAALLTAGCADYAVTFNDRTLYTPPALFSDFSLADEALRECVIQHIIDQEVTSADELTLLDCSQAGITDLTRLEVFTGLTRVRLSGNAIEDVTPLTAATGLEILLLANNRIDDPAPLFALDALERLDLSGNDRMTCPSSRLKIAELNLPEHC